MRVIVAYLGGGNGPDLVVVWAHEHVGKPATHGAQNPLVKVLGLASGNTSLERGVNEALDGLDLVLLGQHGNVVLEGVRNPLAPVTDIGDALVSVPIVVLGEGLVDTVVKVLVVGEDDVAADVVELREWSANRGPIAGQGSLYIDLRSLRG